MVSQEPVKEEIYFLRRDDREADKDITINIGYGRNMEIWSFYIFLDFGQCPGIGENG